MTNPIFHRVSIREFTDQELTEEEVKELLKAGMQAPSARNQQPWEFYVVKSKEAKEKLLGVSPKWNPIKTAPIVIVVCVKKDAPLEGFSYVDCAIASENILIEADILGLGSVWLGCYPVEDRMNGTREALSIPESLVPYAVLPVGHIKNPREQVSRFDESRIHEA